MMIILVFSYFAADTLTNYISFILLLSVFSVTELLSVIKNYNNGESVFYYLDNLAEEESNSKLKYYDFV